MNSVKQFLHKNGVWVAAGAAAVIAGLGIAGAVVVSAQSSTIDDLRSELAQTQGERDSARAEARSVMARKAAILSGAESKASLMVSGAESEAKATRGKLNRLRNEVKATEGELAEVESSLKGAQHTQALSSIEDGTWQSGVDYEPGTYEAPGGESCYWAKLSEPSGSGVEGIIENGGFNNHQVVSVDSPYFETRDCGTWERIGE